MITAPAIDAGARIFLLSPANCGGRRAQMLLRPDAVSPMALRLREDTMTLGEAFTFMSGLYFRGKLAYARAFAANGSSGSTYVITPTRGLVDPDTIVSIDLLLEFATTDIAAGATRYRRPLERDLAALAGRLAPGSRVVLLGSIATDKYLDVLSPALADRLHCPPAFIGRGDVSRGGLLLRHAASGVELDYARLDAAAPRRGPRAAKLAPRDRRTAVV